MPAALILAAAAFCHPATTVASRHTTHRSALHLIVVFHDYPIYG
jgi:hypothetical protein